jgi:hypothetical protein
MELLEARPEVVQEVPAVGGVDHQDVAPLGAARKDQGKKGSDQAGAPDG